MIIIIIIRLFWQHGFLGLFLSLSLSLSLSLAIRPYLLKLLVSSLEVNLYLHRADECKWVYVQETIGERLLWVPLNFTRHVQYVLLVLLWWFLRWKVSSRTTSVLFSATSRICSKQHATSLLSSHLLLSQNLSIEFM